MGKYEEALASAQKLMNGAGDHRLDRRSLHESMLAWQEREAMEIAQAIEQDGALGGAEFALAAIYSAWRSRPSHRALERGVSDIRCCQLFSGTLNLTVTLGPALQQLLRRADFHPDSQRIERCSQRPAT